MSKYRSYLFTEEELTEAFEEVLKEANVATRDDVRREVAKAKTRLQKEHKAASTGKEETMETSEEEGHTYTPSELQEVLPNDLWETVRVHLAEGPQRDMSKSAYPALHNVYSGAQAPSTSPEPSYGDSLSKGEEPVSETLLRGFYGSLTPREPKPVSKSTKPLPPALEAFYGEEER